MANETYRHVVPAGDEWAVKIQGNPEPTSRHATQKAAIQKGRKDAREVSGTLVVHGKNGRIRERFNYN